MFFEDLKDIRFELEEEGINIVEHLKSYVLYEKGGYGVVLFLFRKFNKKENKYNLPEVMVMRFKKVMGLWKKDSQINLGGVDKVKEIIEVLNNWMEESPSKIHPLK